MTLHLLTSFYRSVNDRLLIAVRRHGIDAMRRWCQKLDVLCGARPQKRSGPNLGEFADDAEGLGRSDAERRKSAIGRPAGGSTGPEQRSRAGGDNTPGKRRRNNPPALSNRSVTRVPLANKKPVPRFGSQRLNDSHTAAGHRVADTNRNMCQEEGSKF